MSSRRAFAAALIAVLLIAVGIGSGCESSQSKSAKLDAEGADALTGQEGLNIKKLSTQVDVVDTTVLTDQYGTVAIVGLKNRTNETLLDVPIAINVVDAKGKSLFRNDDPGLAEALVSVPVIRPQETIRWVNDQVFATGEAADVKVEVGEAPETFAGELPELVAGPARLENDPQVGLGATGDLINEGKLEQTNLVVFATAVKGGKVTAAGVGGVRRVKPGKKEPFHVYFIGDPKGADIEMTVFPSPLK